MKTLEEIKDEVASEWWASFKFNDLGENALRLSVDKIAERYSEERLKEARKRIEELEKYNKYQADKWKELEDWKKSQLAVWGPVIDYFQEHGERHGLQLGQSISKFIFDHFETKS